MAQTTGMDRYAVIRANLHEGVTQMIGGMDHGHGSPVWDLIF